MVCLGPPCSHVETPLRARLVMTPRNSAPSALAGAVLLAPGGVEVVAVVGAAGDVLFGDAVQHDADNSIDSDGRCGAVDDFARGAPGADDQHGPVGQRSNE